MRSRAYSRLVDTQVAILNMRRAMRALFFWVVTGLLWTACGHGFDCRKKCEEEKEEILSIGLNVDPATVCKKAAIVQADTCDECKAAFLSEYQIVPVGAAAMTFCDQ